MKRYVKYFSRVAWGAVIVLALLIIASSMQFLGRQSFVVESGSMSPKIPTGSIVFDKSSVSYKAGDVITFKQANSRNTVTHRIFSVHKDAAGKTFYKVKGDANPAPDSDPVAKSSVVGKVYFSVPYVGYVVGLFKTLFGLMVLVIVPGTIIVYREVLKILEELKSSKYVLKQQPDKKAPRTKKSKSMPKAAAGILAGMLILGAASPAATHSYSSDEASVTAVSIKTGAW